MGTSYEAILLIMNHHHFWRLIPSFLFDCIQYYQNDF